MPHDDKERDRERPTDGSEAQGMIDFDAAVEREGRPRNVADRDDDRAGAGGAIDHGAGDAGGTLGTGGRRKQDQ